MYLASISVNGFRSFLHENQFDFDSQLTIIYGPNSVGKTNLLEAIYLLSRGQGFREKRSEELVHMQNGIGEIEGKLIKNTVDTKIKIRLVKKGNQVEKQFFINQHLKSLREYRQLAPAIVLFQPQDLIMINSRPEKRRIYFDQLLGQANYEYYQAKQNYDKGLRRRNKVLEQHGKYKDGDFSNLIEFWSQFLAKNAKIINQGREDIIKYYNRSAELNGNTYKLKYKANKFEKRTLLSQELKWRRTLSGPQLDDFEVHKKDGQEWKNLALYGSRSEQRLAIIWFKTN